MRRQAERVSAVITVYLTLTLLILLALVTVTLESARTAGARFLAESITRLAADSVLAGYSNPLFERYHIFGTEIGAENGRRSSAEVKNRLEDYIELNLQGKDAFLWKLAQTETEITGVACLTDYEGRLFRKEAVEYMQFRGPSLLVEQLLGSLDLFQKADKTMALLQVKSSTEEQLAKIDESILKLFETVDGIRCDRDGIKQSLFGNIKIAGSFVKKLFVGTPDQSAVSVHHPELFAALQPHYTDPLPTIAALRSIGGEYLDYKKAIAELALLQEASEDAAEQLLLEAEQAVLLAGAAERALQYTITKASLSSLLKDCADAASKALAILAEIELRQEIAASGVWEYGEQLTAAAAWLDAELYQELNDSFSIMQQYIGQEVEGTERIIDVAQLRATLEYDLQLLRSLRQTDYSLPGLETEAFWSLSLDALESGCRQYRYNGLAFDYSDMKLKSSGENPLSAFTSFLESGLAGLIIRDMEELSQKAIRTGFLPSEETIGAAAEEGDAFASATNGSSSGIFAMFGEGSPLKGIGNLLAEGASSLTEKLLFLTYLTDHFSDYQNPPENPTVMDYELEYILCGKTEDPANLSTFVVRILLVRTLFSLIHVLGDSEKCNTAKAFAAGLLGFTGLPMLVTAMKFLVLFVWAFEAALVETAAIVQGKKVAVLPTKGNFPVGFEELLIMTKGMIQSKAEHRAEDTGLKLGYREYLLLFLLLQQEGKQNLRTLDLVQENIALEQEGFRMANMLYGFNAEVTYTLPPLFVRLPFSGKSREELYSYKINSGAVY